MKRDTFSCDFEREKEWEEKEKGDEEKEQEDKWEEVERMLPAVWLPEEEGESLEGEVLEKVEGMYGEQLVLGNTEKNIQLRTPSHKVLQRKLKAINVGDWIKIEYSGTIKTGTGRRAENYVVMRRKQSKK